MAEHLRFTVDSGVQLFFCDPCSPWQRGTNVTAVSVVPGEPAHANVSAYRHISSM
jgi:hypothetical protein